MHKKKQTLVGIDVSSKTLDACWSGVNARYSNDRRGWRKLAMEAPENSRFVMEATGSYHFKLAAFLKMRGFSVGVVNPLRARRWIESQIGSFKKTDRMDAGNLSKYGATEAVACREWEPLPPALARARAMITVLANLSKTIKRSKAAMKAVSLAVEKKDGDVPGVLGYVAAVCKEQAEDLEAQLSSIVSAAYPEQFRLVESIPGIGRKTAAVLLVCTRGFEKFESFKRLASYIGVAPTVRESGTSVKGSGRISKAGYPYLRALLNMCAKVAVRCNGACSPLYARLVAKGKKRKDALVAVMHRLVKIAFAVVQSGVPFHGGKEPGPAQ